MKKHSWEILGSLSYRDEGDKTVKQFMTELFGYYQVLLNYVSGVMTELANRKLHMACFPEREIDSSQVPEGLQSYYRGFCERTFSEVTLGNYDLYEEGSVKRLRSNLFFWESIGRLTLPLFFGESVAPFRLSEGDTRGFLVTLPGVEQFFLDGFRDDMYQEMLTTYADSVDYVFFELCKHNVMYYRYFGVLPFGVKFSVISEKVMVGGVR